MKKFFALVLAALMILTAAAFPLVGFAEEAAPVTPAQPVTINLTGIVVAIIGLIFNFLLAWLGKKVVPPLKKWLEEKTTTEQRNAMWNVIVKLVEAAEQVIGAGKGSEKMQYVKDALLAAGYEVDVDLIEAAVKEMNDKVLDAIEYGFSLEDGKQTENALEKKPE